MTMTDQPQAGLPPMPVAIPIEDLIGRGLPTQKATIHKDDVCKVCHEKIVGEDLKLIQDIMVSDVMGVVHQACFLPYHPEHALAALVTVRCYSIGDTIASTPAIRELRRMYPNMKITVLTFYPELFKYNPHIAGILDLNQPVPAKAVEMHHFRLDAFNSANLHHFAMHSVDFAFQSTFSRSGFPGPDWEYEVMYHQDDYTEMQKIIREAGIDPEKDKLILLHPHGTEWKTRDWGPYNMPQLAALLHSKYPEHKIVSIGGKRGEVPKQELKNYVALPKEVPHVELYGKLSLLQSAAFMDLPACKLLVTPDTGTLHLGGSRQELPIVGIFTLIKAYFRTPVRRGRMGYKFIGVEASSGCNCTYDAKLLTHESFFGTCPKKKFLDRTLRRNIPTAIKLEGMKNYAPERKWDEKNLGKEIRKELQEYPDDALPCFPDLTRVFNACVKMLNETGGV